MSSLIGSHGMALATAVAAVSGTVILITICRQKPPSSAAAQCSLRSCITSEERKRERGRASKRKKRVHFAKDKDLVVEFDGKEKVGLELGSESVRARGAAEVRRGMPANRVALYRGVLQDRSKRVVCAH